MRHLLIPSILCLLLADLIAIPAASAQDALHADAGRPAPNQERAHEGSAPPDSLRQAAYAHSWQGRYEEAIAAFEQVLTQQPGDADAETGLGFTYAWSGDYRKAHEHFLRALRIDPSYEGARKGEAYTCLWEKNPGAASRHFLNLSLAFPQNAEYFFGLGESYRLSGQSGKAATAYRSALKIAPSFPMARQALDQLRIAAAPLEIDVWGGASRIGGLDGQGLRLVQVAAQLNPRLRLFSRFDNSLSVDNLDLLRRREAGQVYSLGGYYLWNDHTGTTIEGGSRHFGQNLRQQTIRAEQVVFLPGKGSLKGGLLLGFSDQLPTEMVFFAGGSWPVTDWLSVEPSYFFSRFTTLNYDHRGLLSFKIRTPKGYELNLGTIGGLAKLDGENDLRNLFGGYAYLILPVSRPVWIQCSYRYENGFFDELNAFALGLRVRLGAAKYP